MEKIKPLKKFSQNFLVDQNIINKIIREISPQKEDTIIEIGPGQGALTKGLAEHCNKITAVEIDKRTIENLKEEFENINILNQDFLKLKFEDFGSDKKHSLRIVGNIPYKITSPIIFKLIENKNFVKDATLMVQLEVAKRLCAKKGSKDYSILSVLLNNYADVRLRFKISPNVFYPKPKVFSAIIKIDFTNSPKFKVNEELFVKVVKASFGNRRKTLKNSLKNSIFQGCNFLSSPIGLSKRAEELSIKDFVLLTSYLEEELYGRNK